MKRVLASNPFVPPPYARAAAAATVRPKAMIAAITKIHFVTVGQVSVLPVTDNDAPNGLPRRLRPMASSVNRPRP